MSFLEEKKFLVIVTIIGLLGVAITYYAGTMAMPNGINDIWGNMPSYFRPIYIFTAILALLGYALVLFFLIFKTDLVNYYPMSRSVIVVLVASMLWLPYTAQMIDNPTSFTWIKIRLALLMVGLGAWFMFRRLSQLIDEDYGVWLTLSRIGAGLFLFHTMVMDAIIWPYLFQ